MGSTSRRSDYGEEFVERLRRDRYKKSYIVVNGVSSEEEEDELDLDEEDYEMASYAEGPVHQKAPPSRPASVRLSRRPPSVAASLPQRAGGFNFDARDLYFFGVLTEITDKFTPDRLASHLMSRSSAPPPEFRTLPAIERVAYLYYYFLYGRYLNVPKFHNVFNREFYKYTSLGDSERNAFLKICRHTLEEYKRRMLERNKLAYKLAQKQMFCDERDTPDSRASDRPSLADGFSENSILSLGNELMFYRAPHTPIHFASCGRIVYINPDVSISIVCIDNTKNFYKDAEGRRYVEMFENFKGPLLVGHTPPQTPLLFIQRQIERIFQSDVYHANPKSGDANDCILIWALLEMLIRQQGKVTGPDLARLLCSNDHFSTMHSHDFLRTDSSNSVKSSRSVVDPQAIERITRYLLGGHVDEAIESAIADGLLFDALILAHRLFRHDSSRLEQIEAKLMAHRSPLHPVTTLLSVAADLPVPLLNNPTSDDTNGWRAHIAIVLANLNTQNAMDAVYHLGLALAQKEFNAAADFCFLAVNLLTGYNCFQPPVADPNDDQPKYRRHITLLNASIPDDNVNACVTRFGWSIFDYQATEIYEYALRLGNSNAPTVLSHSSEYIQIRKQYAQLLGELGGFGHAVGLYNSQQQYSGDERNSQPRTPSPPPQFNVFETVTMAPPLNDGFPPITTELPPQIKETPPFQNTAALPPQIKEIPPFQNTTALPPQIKEIPPFQNKKNNYVVDDDEFDAGIQQQPLDDGLPLGATADFPEQTKEVVPVLGNEKNNPDNGGGSGFLVGKIGGLFSKMKLQGQQEMKLPDDKHPKIVWDAQKGKYVDQGQAIEESVPPPPPSIPQQKQQHQHQHNYQQQQQQKESASSSPVESQKSPLPHFFPQIPVAPLPAPAAKPFRGVAKARYANAWNS